MQQIKESDVKALLTAMADNNLPDLDRESLKDFLRGLIDHVTFDHSSLAYCIHYKIKLTTGDFVASPGGFDQIPTISKRVNLQISRTRHAA